MPNTVTAQRTDIPKPQATSWKKRLRDIGPPVVSFVVAFGLWEAIVAMFDVPTYVVPAPRLIFQDLFSSLNTLAFHAGITLLEAVAGFLIGSILGALLGALFVVYPILERSLLPYVVASNTIPIVAVAPIVILWFGYGMQSKIAVTAFLSFFPLCINMMKGLKSYDPLVMELFHVSAATGRQRFWKMRIQYALPFVFSGLKLNVTFAIIGAIVAEFVGSNQGLGFLIIQSSYVMNMPRLWSTMLVSSVVGIVFFGVVAAVERLVIPWHQSMRTDN